jgi:Holliday junction resolvase RusA-like endonuclease
VKIEFTVYGNPKAQKRHRDRKGGKGKYDPSKPDKKSFLAKAVSAMPPEPPEMPVKLEISCCFQRPLEHFHIKNGKKTDRIKKRFLDEGCTINLDADNLAKFVMDALNKKAWIDDRQIWDLRVWKLWAGGPYEGEPRTEICIEYDMKGVSDGVSNV